nr:putative ribonuclease H-like domain-containing protein [Tanacetum cinerariifolium]
MLVRQSHKQENLDQIHDRLQKLVSQLEIHGVSLSQEDVNLKFLRSLPSEWKTHTLIWRNKADLEEHSNATQNLAFVSSSNTVSTSDSVRYAPSVSAVCTQLPVSSHPSIDSLGNAVIFSFFASQSNSPQLDNEDLKQIDADDLEEMELRWQMVMLTMRARKFLQKTGRNLGNNKTMGFDMSKVECYNCHRKGHFTRECRSPKDTRRTGAAEPHRRTAPVKTSTSNALVSQCDRIGSYDWSYQAKEEPANFALMAILSLSSPDNEVEARDNYIISIKQKLNQAKTERDDLKLKLEKFQSSSKSLTNLIASQTNSTHGLGYISSKDDSENVSLTSPSDRLPPSGGYHIVPSPITGNFMPPKPDLVFNTASFDVEYAHSAYNVQLSPAKPTQAKSHTNESLAPIIEDWVFDSKDESEPNDQQNVSSSSQTTEHVKTPRHSIEAPIPAVTPKPTCPKTSCSGKKKNRKTCFACRSRDRLIKDCKFHDKPQTKPSLRNDAQRGFYKQHASFYNKYPPKHIVPATVLSKSKPVSVTAVRPTTTVPKIMNSRPKYAHRLDTKSKSIIRRHKTHSYFSKSSNSSSRVTAAKVEVVPTAKAKVVTAAKDKVVFAAKGKQGKWGNPQYALKDKGVIDSGCSRHMTGNMSYLSDFQELNGGYVAFGGNPKGGKISGKGKIKTGKQHKASCKTKPVSFVTQLLFRLHMDLFGPTFVKSLNKKSHCIVITDDYSRFTWVFFLATKDETSPILKTFITGLENQLSLKVKIIRSDNRTEFKIFDLNQFCELKRIKREFSVPRTPQQNRIVERKNRTLIEAARTMLADSLLHIPFWAEAVNTACYVQNKPNIAGTGPPWLFDTDSLTRTMNYQPVTAGNQTNPNAGFQEEFNAGKTGEEANQQYMIFSLWSTCSTNPQNKEGDATFDGKEHDFEDFSKDSSNDVSTASPIVPAAGQNCSNNTNLISAARPSNSNSSSTHGNSSLKNASQSPDVLEMENIVYSDTENVGAEADFKNLESSITVSPIPTTRIHNAHPISQIIGKLSSTTQTRSMARIIRDQGGISQVLNEDFHTCMC